MKEVELEMDFEQLGQHQNIVNENKTSLLLYSKKQGALHPTL